MVQEIRRELENVPEEVKTAFRVIQNSDETEELSHGDPVALYRQSEISGYRTDARWIRLGTYDSMTDNMISEYMITYEPDKEKFGAQPDISERNLERTDGKIVSVPERIYDSALEELHNTL